MAAAVAIVVAVAVAMAVIMVIRNYNYFTVIFTQGKFWNLNSTKKTLLSYEYLRENIFNIS